MDAKELREEYLSLYEYMSQNRKVEYMKTFGRVMGEMMDWLIANKPEIAQMWIEKLESIKWKNYVTPSEADKVVAAMEPKAPWGKEQWRQNMERYGYKLEEWPNYNKCALYTTMNMIMSDSGKTLVELVGDNNLFMAVYKLALDKLHDADSKFNIRTYFAL